MADQDWRLHVRLEHDGQASDLVDRLNELEFGHDARQQLGERIVVSKDGPEVFLYADTESAGREAERVVRGELERESWNAEIRLDRWHPIEEEWKDAAEPMPQSEEEREREHATLMAQEERETRERGYSEFEVRVDLPSWHAATELSKQLDDEGLPHVRRWKYLVLGAVNEDAANELAERMGREAPDGAEVTVEGTFIAAQDERPYKAFSFFGI
jgi:hypothetical protein